MRPVVTTSGQSVLVSDTALITQVASSATVVDLLAANFGRVMGTFFNDSTATLYLRWGAAASATLYTAKVPSQGYYELPLVGISNKPYVGLITGIWASANGFCNVTEAA